MPARLENLKSSSAPEPLSTTPSKQGDKKNNETSYGSSCGIKSLNGYMNTGPQKTREANKERADGRAWAGASTTHGDACRAAAHAGACVDKLGDDFKAMKAEAEAAAETGEGGWIAEAGARVAGVSHSTDTVDVDIAKGQIGGALGIGPSGAKAKVQASLDIVDTTVRFSENQSMNANLGFNIDTGGEIGIDGVSASVLGWGVSAGRNTGIHTPIGSISFKLW